MRPRGQHRKAIGSVIQALPDGATVTAPDLVARAGLPPDAGRRTLARVVAAAELEPAGRLPGAGVGRPLALYRKPRMAATDLIEAMRAWSASKPTPWEPAM